jgi:putative inorganic carbon (HCO3(-)) transporter
MMRPQATEGEGDFRGVRAEAGQDFWACVLLGAFCVQLYAVPGEWLPAFEPLRLALSLSLAALGLLLLNHIGRRLPFRGDGVRGVALGAFTAWALLSRTWSVVPERTDEWLGMFLKVVVAWFLVVNLAATPKRLRGLCLALIAGSLVTSVGTLQTYFSGEKLSQGFRGRWVGVFGDPNYLANYLGMIVPVALAFLAHRGTSKRVRLLCLTALVLAISAIVLTFSRGGFLGLVAGLVVWSVRERAQRGKALLLASALAAGVAIFAPATYWERNETVEDFQTDASALGRVYAWHVASAMNADRPIRGVGGGAFRDAWPSYAPPEARKALVAHNIFLDTLGELGWVGFFLFLIFVGSATGAVFRAGEDPEMGWLARGLGASVAGYLLCNCFAGSMVSAHLFVLLGLAGAVERLTEQAQPVPEPLPAPAAAWS